ncbi:MAG: isoleucine--tRNA ligase [Acidimicrobiales bacterium]|jgi:isoleucyl-tRNA synthetase|nr:isoleucine--tRNA ligase [Acidimicrobiales bacterium]MDP7117659.1 isoleucine--tRNA ligase [Acidimicrobiales bacterium]MDP7411014.1 isoleucine--tRNA ligase [Acidimicrobiales bacterium]MEE1522643.1 isoleucine--tRNA ligase [Acidimicrobiales bacterium]MEE1570410.1 isoleucine--tRNA ligase [Acidimicrobiales bacterium]
MSSQHPSEDAYPEVGKADFPSLEARILERWATEGTFQASVDARSSDDEFTFNDGPPFANGLPHHGHLLTGYVKDVVPRYQTMRGKKVTRRFGWDCHGLPAEMEAEKELPVAGRASIIDYGIEAFNAHCRSSVLRYTDEWEQTVTRQARWVDFDHDYKTMDRDYMESVMWAFRQLWDKGLVYEAFRVMPYSWGAETPLSNFEIRLDDATRPRQDPAVTVGFDLEPSDGDPGPMRLLAWTTTPWTLPSNLAIAVGPEVAYSMHRNSDGTVYVLSSGAVGRYAAQLKGTDEVGTLTGADLVGRNYRPLFGFFSDRTDAFRVLSSDFVDAAEGTGVVHMAPGFGEDDQTICEANGIQIGRVVPVDDQGCFTDEVADWAGVNVFEANPDIIRSLKESGRILRHDTYEHNYPHCWRTDTPIIYKAISSWYVKVTDIRERMIELNADINWVPDHVRDGRFGMWLDGARDWSISRNRFWGSPIPVWKSDNPEYPRTDVYGSLDEVEADFGVRPDDLHRPFIDDLTRPNPDDPTGASTMRRVPEVLDCWFESGSMPFAQFHYPFDNEAWFEDHFPADFIVEYINQTRGWFYTMHVLATALFDRPAFENVICHGILLAEDGAKLSKKLRNYTEPSLVFEQQGSDALRWYLMSSNISKGGDLRISDPGITDVVRQVLLPVWNAFSFFTLYANADGHRAQLRADSWQLLDRYLLAKTRTLVESVTERMDAYDLPGATAEIRGFIDALNNWYIRRSRDRFWARASESNDDDKRDAYDTLYTVLVTFSKVVAPFLPMVMEEVHTGLTGLPSVHLTDWPNPAELPSDPDLVARMDRVRDVASTALRLREDNGLRVRLPLTSLTVAGADSEALAGLTDLLVDEVNVKAVHLTDDLEGHATFTVRPDGRALGPRLGDDVQAVFAAARSGEFSLNDDGTVDVAGHTLSADEFDLALESPEGVTAAALGSADAVVVLDAEVTPELVVEGLARDVVRQVQQARRDADLVVTDRINLRLSGDEAVLDAVRIHQDYVAGQVLATELSLGEVPADAVDTEVEGLALRISLSSI